MTLATKLEAYNRRADALSGALRWRTFPAVAMGKAFPTGCLQAWSSGCCFVFSSWLG